MNQTIKYGFYSKEAAELFGSILYKQGDKIVEVTAIYSDKDAKEYGWEDKICVGIVDSYYGKGVTDYLFDFSKIENRKYKKLEEPINYAKNYRL